MISNVFKTVCFSALFCASAFGMQQKKIVISRFDTAAEFAAAVRLAQNGWVIEWVGAAVCAKLAIGLGAVALWACIVSLAVAGAGQGQDPAVIFAALAGVLAVTAGATSAGLAYGSYRLVTRSTDYGAAHRVASVACPHCLRKVLADPKIRFVLSENMIQAILDALNEGICTGACSEEFAVANAQVLAPAVGA